MLKGKLKLPAPDKPGTIFPDRLGSLVMAAGLDEKGSEIERFEVEFGEELAPIKPGAFEFHRESDDGDEAIDGEKDDKDQRIRQKPNKDAVAVATSISLEEKRSELEYEVGVVLVFLLNILGHEKLKWSIDYALFC